MVAKGRTALIFVKILLLELSYYNKGPGENLRWAYRG